MPPRKRRNCVPRVLSGFTSAFKIGKRPVRENPRLRAVSVLLENPWGGTQNK